MSQNNDTELKIYEFTNKTTGKKHFSMSDNAQDACKQAGWLIDDCLVREIYAELKASDKDPLQTMIATPCQVCPYQYAECTKLTQDECPVRHDTPTLAEWLKNVATAHLCKHTGQELTQKDYYQRRKWTLYGETIKGPGHNR